MALTFSTPSCSLAELIAVFTSLTFRFLCMCSSWRSRVRRSSMLRLGNEWRRWGFLDCLPSLLDFPFGSSYPAATGVILWYALARPSQDSNLDIERSSCHCFESRMNLHYSDVFQHPVRISISTMIIFCALWYHALFSIQTVRQVIAWNRTGNWGALISSTLALSSIQTVGWAIPWKSWLKNVFLNLPF